MNLSTPILICDENEEIRLLLKDMLTKNGCFHLLEAQTDEELLHFVTDDHFILINMNLISDEVKKILHHRKNFLIIAQVEHPQTIALAAFFGVEHIISFPYSSKSLFKKINRIASMVF